MNHPKLEREECPRDFNIRSGDSVEVWQWGSGCNVTIKDKDGNDVLRLLGMSTKHATDMLEGLAGHLGTTPPLTTEKLRTIYNELRTYFEQPWHPGPQEPP